MSIASYRFVGEVSDAEKNDGLEGGPAEDRAEFYRVMSTHLTDLYLSIKGEDVSLGQPVAMEDDYSVITYLVPDGVVDVFQAIKEDTVPGVVEQWKTKGGVPYDNNPDLNDLVRALIRLSKRAKQQGKNLYFWNCL